MDLGKTEGQRVGRALLLAFLTFVAAAGVMAIPACAPGTNIATTPPAALAGASVLDEKAVLGAELAYKAMRTAGTIAIDAGVLKGDRAARVAVIDNRAYAAVLLARRAYSAGNANDYGRAVGEALSLIGEAQALLAGPG